MNSEIRLRQWTRQGVALFDGAMGTELSRRFRCDPPYEQLNLSHPELVAGVHKAYLEAGADIIRTNSFQANRISLLKFGLGDHVVAINRSAVTIARGAISAVCPNRNVLIAGSIGPISGDSPDRQSSEESRRRHCAIFRQQGEALIEAGAGMLVAETFQRIDEITAFLDAILPLARQARPKVVVAVCVSTPDNSEQAAVLAAEFSHLIAGSSGVSLVGFNCGYGPTSLIDPTIILREKTSLPIALLPSAGFPILDGPVVRYPCGSDEFVASLLNLAKHQTVQAVGGCCGTTPEYIAALGAAIAEYRAN